MTIAPAIIDTVRETIGLAGDPASHRVVCAMSGGVDSTVAAALVKAAGFETVGITLQLYDHGEAIRRKGACCAGQDIRDARKAASQLGIPHYVLDFESRFREAVIDDFAASYASGYTPVPCIRCNQTVKFADLLGRARDLDASALVTGHYITSRARVRDPQRRDLYTPAETARDQSYFLFATTREQADFLRFPLGDLPKATTRAIAADLGLDVAMKPDSQDICFVPDGDYAAIVARLRPDAVKPGDIRHIDGRVLGRHKGTIHFTVGQRKGLGIAHVEPLYVLRVDAEKAEVIVGPRESLLSHEVHLAGLNWLGDEEPGETPLPVMARIRSTRPPVEAALHVANGRASVFLPGGEYGVSPGQACVFYDGTGPGSRMLGGGFITGPQAPPRALPEGISAAK
ncbi:MAG: tRNA 2-thiouridine(34) synthase MnmA [Parvibaculaceae bacterium]